MSEDPKLPSDAAGLRPAEKRGIRGDLDRIVLHALARDPARRYSSVEQLRADVERYRRGLPVSARRAGVWYRVRKFVARNPVAVVAGIIAAISLIFGAAIALWKADQAAAGARNLRRMAVEMLSGLEGHVAELPGTIEVRQQLIEIALRHLEQASHDHPSLKMDYETGLAHLRLGDVLGLRNMVNLADTPAALEEYDKAEPLLQRAMEEEREYRAEATAAYLDLHIHKAGALADPLQAMDALNRVKGLAEEQINNPAALLATRGDLYFLYGGEYLELAGRLAEARQWFNRGLQVNEAALRQHPEEPDLLERVGVERSEVSRTYILSNQPELALQGLAVCSLLTERAASLAPSNEEYRRNAAVLSELKAEVFTMLGRGSDALATLVMPETTLRKLVSTESTSVQRHFDLAMCLRRKSDALWLLGQLEESRQAIREAIALCDAAVGKDGGAFYFRVSLATLLNRAGARLSYGNVSHFQRALETADAVSLKRACRLMLLLHGERARSLCGLGQLVAQQKRLQEAEKLLSAGVGAWKELPAYSPKNWIPCWKKRPRVRTIWLGELPPAARIRRNLADVVLLQTWLNQI